MGSPSAIITLGLGSWGSVNEVVTLGYGIGEVSEAIPDQGFILRDQRSGFVLRDQRSGFIVRE